MKTIKKIFLAVVIALGLASCDMLSELSTLKLDDVEISQTIPVTVASPMAANGMRVAAADVMFSKSAKVSLTSVSELKDYLSVIKSINVDSINVTISGIANGDVKSLTLKVNPLNYTRTINNIVPGSNINVTFNASELTMISESLLTNQELEFVLDGVVSKTPITFDIEVTLFADFVVKIIESDNELK